MEPIAQTWLRESNSWGMTKRALTLNNNKQNSNSDLFFPFFAFITDKDNGGKRLCLLLFQ